MHKADQIGDLVEVQARLAYTGNTSMHIAVEVRSGDIKAGTMEKTTECVVVFVSVDEHGKPMPVDGWNLETLGEVVLAGKVRTKLEASRVHHH